jgi:IS5 family transposase
VIARLNEALLEKADTAHLVKLDKVRADTTVMPTNVTYPTDSGLLTRGVSKLARTVSSLKSLGFASRTPFRDRTRSPAATTLSEATVPEWTGPVTRRPTPSRGER